MNILVNENLLHLAMFGLKDNRLGKQGKEEKGRRGKKLPTVGQRRERGGRWFQIQL
jgi:hypothetical protein